MRNLTRIVIVTASAPAPLVGLAAGPAGAAGCIPGFTDAGHGICTADFVMTGAPESFTLPANVASIDVVVAGAQGGASHEERVDPLHPRRVVVTDPR